MSITSISMKNFKQFDQFSISCREKNILVGPNNSGKSTILDALRICNDILRYSKRRNPNLESQGEYGVCPTYVLSHSQISINTLHFVRNYGDEDAQITIEHANKNILYILLHPDRSVRAFLKNTGPNIRTSSQFSKAFPMNILLVPTLGPFEPEERFVTDETVVKNENTRLAHRTFRNILHRKSIEDFRIFSDLISAVWPGVEIKRPTIVGVMNPNVEMFFTEGRMTREVATSGFGFQVWMQMMLQVMRGAADNVLILDEPDIYLHPDLQRKLVRLVCQRFGQIFLATHSTEIINEMNTGDIVTIDSSRKRARRITSEDGYRELFNYIGSSENAEFARLARAKRVLFFEGNDKKILRKFANKIPNVALLDDPDTVFLKAGGFGQWKRVKEVGWTLDKMFGMRPRVAAIFDRDYRSDDEIIKFEFEINSGTIKCHVLRRKEIENYALEYATLVRLIVKKSVGTKKEFNIEGADKLISRLTEDQHELVRSQIVGGLFSFRRKHNSDLHETTIASEGMKIFDQLWSNKIERLYYLPGKDFISSLSSALADECGVSITIVQIINEMKQEEISEELVSKLQDIQSFFEGP